MASFVRAGACMCICLAAVVVGIAATGTRTAVEMGVASDAIERSALAPTVGATGSLCLFSQINGSRTVKLPAQFFGPEPCVFSSGMVLRAADAQGLQGTAGTQIWGFGVPGETVTVAVDGAAAATATADGSGRWSAKLVGFNASRSPHAIDFAGSKSKATSTLTNVLFGDVILCSGQSNMDFAVSALDGRGGCFAWNETVTAAASGKYDDIRIMKGPSGAWVNSSSNGGKNVGAFSAVCYLTALQIKKQIPGHADRPMGLVQSSVGGTVIEAWMSTQALEQCLPSSESQPGQPCAAGSQKNSVLYYSLVAPLAPMSLTATLWYQGESNVAQNSGTKDSKFKGYYACLFRSKVQAWRKQFESPSMFYGFVSLAAYGEADASPAVRTSDALPFMRMDQNSVLALDTTGVALALDLGDDGKVPFTPPSSRHGGIHPRNKTEVARRMALEYGRVALGLSMVSQGPTNPTIEGAASMDAGDTVVISFENTGLGVYFGATAQCNTHGSPRDPPAIPAGAPCCNINAPPRLKAKDGSGEDAGMPFEILDASSGKYVLPASMKVDATKMKVVLQVPPSIKPARVRYSYQSYPYCVLRNEAGLPAMPFTTNITHTNPL